MNNAQDMGIRQGPLQVAAAFAELSANSARAANVNRAEIARRNIDAGMAELDLQESAARRKLTQEFERHAGAVRANAAFRGVAHGETVSAAVDSAARLAGQEAALVSANRAVAETALILREDFMREDVGLAMIRGGLEGFALGQQIQASLDAQTNVTTHEGRIVERSMRRPAGLDASTKFSGTQTVATGDITHIQTPGFNLADLLGI